MSLLHADVAGDVIDVFLGFHIWTVIVIRSIVSVSLVASIVIVTMRFVTIVPIMSKMFLERRFGMMLVVTSSTGDSHVCDYGSHQE